jgi:ElaB/YqjD/DUF883 family membrane-anchored ribosome-binding protein
MRRDQYDPEEVTDDRPDHTAPSGQVAAGSATSTMRSTTSDVQRQAGEVAESAEKQAAALKDKAMEQASAGKEKAASGLHSAAEQVRTRTGDSDAPKDKVMAKAADTMDKSADYIADREPREMWDDFEKFVKDHPLQAAAGALVAGVVLGRIFL